MDNSHNSTQEAAPRRITAAAFVGIALLASLVGAIAVTVGRILSSLEPI